MASARVMAGRMVVRRRASIDLPAPGGPSKRTLWAERLHHVQLRIHCIIEFQRERMTEGEIVPQMPPVLPTAGWSADTLVWSGQFVQ
jgi:hypothetical protein